MEKIDSTLSSVVRLMYLVMVLSLALFPVSASAHYSTDSHNPTLVNISVGVSQIEKIQCAGDHGTSKQHRHSNSDNSGDKSGSSCCNAVSCGFSIATVSEFSQPQLVAIQKFEITNEHGIFRVFHGLNRPPSA